MARLTGWATDSGFEVDQVVAEVGSGLNGKRPKLARVLSDPDARVIVVEHRDRLARFGVEHLNAALAAQGRRIVVVDDGETTDHLVRDMVEVLPRLGRIRTHESTRKLARRLDAGTARILSVTVRFTGGRWQCTFQVIVEGKKRPAHARRSEHPVVGADVGVKDLLVVATPEGAEVARVAAPTPLTWAQSRLRAAQRQLARRHGPYDPDTKTRREPSKRWERATARVRRIHAQVAAIRAHQIHKATTDLAVAHEVIAVEQLSAKNMARHGGRRKRGLNRALGDAAIGHIRTQLDYKTTWYATTLVTAPRFFASTQLCSRCGVKTKLRLRDRIYRCRNGCRPLCRDLNAATNLARLGDPGHGGTGTGTGSRPAASGTAGDGRGAIQKTSPTTSGAVGTAGGNEASTPHTTNVGVGTATPQGEAA